VGRGVNDRGKIPPRNHIAAEDHAEKYDNADNLKHKTPNPINSLGLTLLPND
jgi:hypothetical protein